MDAPSFALFIGPQNLTTLSGLLGRALTPLIALLLLCAGACLITAHIVQAHLSGKVEQWAAASTPVYDPLSKLADARPIYLSAAQVEWIRDMRRERADAAISYHSAMIAVVMLMCLLAYRSFMQHRELSAS